MSTSAAAKEGKAAGKPRYRRIDRVQTFLAPVDVEMLIPPGHRARAIWELSGQLDFNEWEKGIEAREGSAGRPCFAPRLLAAIWLYGYSIGGASARALSRMTAWEPGLRWLTVRKWSNCRFFHTSLGCERRLTPLRTCAMVFTPPSACDKIKRVSLQA